MEKGLIKDILLKLNDDFSNIDEVYNSLKNNWFEKNEGKSELEFIDSFDFTKGYDVDTINESLFAEIQLKNLKKLSTYLGKKPAKLELTLTDHYYKYKRSKRFGFATTLALNNVVFKNNDFQTAKQELDKQFEIFEFIYDKLNDIDKLEFKSDYCDQLGKLKSNQQLSKFQALIDIQLSKIKGHCDKNKLQPKTENKNPGRKSVEVKEAKEYLQKIELPENKVKFLNALKKDYEDVTPKTFNHVMIALNDLGYLKPASKTEYRQAFEKALSREPQSKANFNKQFVDAKNADPNFYNSIKSNIYEIIQSQTLV